MMTRTASLALALSTVVAATAGAREDSKVYQLRTYEAAAGKLDVLLGRFEESNLPLFEEHGITLEGAWTPHESDEGGERLVYLVSFPDREAAERAWDAFGEDPEWRALFEAEKAEHGEVVGGVETVYLAPTDYSPAPKQALEGAPTDEDGRLYELRRYAASPGKLEDLNERFREHTIELFAKHGMTSVVYTEPMGDQDGAGGTLVYFLAHPSMAEARNSWQGFRTDPEWHAARDASQGDGVRLAAEVESTFLVPTRFSPMK